MSLDSTALDGYTHRTQVLWYRLVAETGESALIGHKESGMNKNGAMQAVESRVKAIFAETPHKTGAENEALGSGRPVRVDGGIYWVAVLVIESATATPVEKMPDFSSKAQQYRWLAEQAEKREAIAALKASI